MAMVSETRRERDFTKRDFSRGELLAGEFNAQAAHVLANRATMLLTKDACEMYRVNPGDFGYVLKDKRLREISIQIFFDLFEPTRGFPCHHGDFTARRFG